jgi:hypothetical protein
MKRLVLLLIFLSVTRVAYGGVDPRFEGVWVGVETFQVPANFMQKGEAPFQKPVVIAVGDAGRLVGVVQGFGVARYQIWEQRTKGNTLAFRSLSGPSLDVGRHEGILTLSSDGNVVTEKGSGLVAGSSGHPVFCQITATLHRRGRK